MEATSPYLSPQSDVATSDADTYRPQIFSMAGRIGRARYVVYSFVWNLLWVPILLLAVMALEAATESAGGVVTFFVVAYSGPIAIMFVMARRRLNDLNLTGWFALLLLVPLVNIPFTLYLMLWPGSRVANDFGPPPVANPAAMVVALVLLLGVPAVGVIAAVAIPAFVQ